MTIKFSLLKYTFFTAWILLSVSAFGQSRMITGKITGTDGEPLTGAIAELRNSKDSSLAKVNVADAMGSFSFENVKVGNYFLKATLLGYTAYKSDAFAFDATQTKEFSEIKL